MISGGAVNLINPRVLVIGESVVCVLMRERIADDLERALSAQLHRPQSDRSTWKHKQKSVGSKKGKISGLEDDQRELGITCMRTNEFTFVRYVVKLSRRKMAPISNCCI